MSDDTEKLDDLAIDPIDWLAAEMAKAPSDVMATLFQCLDANNASGGMKALVLREFAEGCLFRFEKLGERKRLEEITNLVLSMERELLLANNKMREI